MDIEQRMRLFHRLRAVSVELERGRAEFARMLGLHPTDMHAVIALLDAGRAGIPATPGWLGVRLGLNSAGTTKLLDRLEDHGLVHRSADDTDRRRTLLEVTPSAIRTGQEFFGPTISRSLEAMDSFSDRQLATVDRFLSAILAATEG